MFQHPITHIELSAKDPSGAGKFYGDLFGWKIVEMPEMNYVTFESEEGHGGGFVTVGEQGFEVGDIVPYVTVPDIDAALARAEELGGKMLMPKTEIPGVGWFAHFSDPTGNRLALYTSLEE
jgi:predicted enzyme related to lactoylglutathione lyase